MTAAPNAAAAAARARAASIRNRVLSRWAATVTSVRVARQNPREIALWGDVIRANKITAQ